MELKHIHRDDSPDGVFINASAFDPSIHREWVAPTPIPDLPQTVEISGLQEPIAPDLPPAIAPDPPKKLTKKKV